MSRTGESSRLRDVLHGRQPLRARLDLLEGVSAFAAVAFREQYDQGPRSPVWKGNMSEQYERVFAQYDTDGDGQLTVDEVTAAIAGMFPASEVNDLSGVVKALFVEYDTDQDGLLSVAEFVPLAKNLPELGTGD